MAWPDPRRRAVAESYVNLIPTVAAGTHVNGLRTGFTERCASFCDFRNLLPRGISGRPRTSGTGRLRAQHQDDRPAVKRPDQGTFVVAAGGGFRQSAAHDCLLALAQPRTPTSAKRSTQLAIERATRLKSEKQIVRKKVPQGPPSRKLPTAFPQDLLVTDCSWSRDSAGGSAAGARKDFQDYPAVLRGKILNTWEVASAACSPRRSARHSPLESPGCDRARDHLRTALRQGVDPRRRRFRRTAYRHLAERLFLKTLPGVVLAGPVFVAMPPLFRSTSANRFSTPGRRGSDCCWSGSTREAQGRGQRHPLQGPRRDEPAAAA